MKLKRKIRLIPLKVKDLPKIIDSAKELAPQYNVEIVELKQMEDMSQVMIKTKAEKQDYLDYAYTLIDMYKQELIAFSV